MSHRSIKLPTHRCPGRVCTKRFTGILLNNRLKIFPTIESDETHATFEVLHGVAFILKRSMRKMFANLSALYRRKRNYLIKKCRTDLKPDLF